MKRQIINLFVLAVPFSLIMLIFYSCGNDTVTPNTSNNTNCGSHHTIHYGPFNYIQNTNTFVENGTTRVFQFSAIPTSIIDSICTHGKPVAEGSAIWTQSDTTRSFSLRLVVVQDPLFVPYSSDGTIVPGQSYDWNGSVNVGLVQSYGNGPGKIYDLRVEVRFRSFGTEQQDLAWLLARSFGCSMTLNYDDYKP